MIVCAFSWPRNMAMMDMIWKSTDVTQKEVVCRSGAVLHCLIILTFFTVELSKDL